MQTTTAYDRQLARSQERQRQISTSGREIAVDLSTGVNWRRRSRAVRDFQFFCTTYFPDVFYLPFSPDHIRVIQKIERAATKGGLFAMAMPRGSGKSALCRAACLWCVLSGLHQYVVMIGPTESHAIKMLAGVRTQLESNKILRQDFWESCYPISRLEGITQRRLLWDGRLVDVDLKEKEIVLPSEPARIRRGKRTIPNRSASCRIEAAGLGGHIRGKNVTRSDGSEVRPSFVLLDDPQDDESARSPAQVEKRESLIRGTVLGLAGPGKQISAVMPCTVIAPGDLADRFLDRTNNPQWQGERTKLIYQWPKAAEAESHWAKYGEIVRLCLVEGREIAEATDYVKAHYDVMHDGAVVAWPERKRADELSALQHAWNIRIDRGDAAFLAEYQNDPIRPKSNEERPLDADTLCARLNRVERGVVPGWATHLTGMIDCSAEILYWVVSAWGPGFSGAVVDYGSYPDQGRDYFSHGDVRQTLQRELPDGGLEAQLFQGLQRLTSQLLGREWSRDGGGAQRIDGLLIDGNWERDTVYSFCRQSPFAGQLLPSHGRYVGASSLGLNANFGPKPGDKTGMHWRTLAASRTAVKYALFDTNFWKSFIAARFLTPLGGRGAVVLPGESAAAHRMLADHFTAEVRVPTFARGNWKDEWRQQAGRDNHWWDCMVGSAVMASIKGVELLQESRTDVKRVSFSQQQAQRRGKVPA